MRPEDAWRVNAACRGLDPSIFYPVTIDPAEAAPAKAVCQACPVRAECLAEAQARREPDGIFGGLTHEERLRERTRRR